VRTRRWRRSCRSLYIKGRNVFVPGSIWISRVRIGRSVSIWGGVRIRRPIAGIAIVAVSVRVFVGIGILIRDIRVV